MWGPQNRNIIELLDFDRPSNCKNICKTWDPRNGAYEDANILEIYAVRTGI